MDRILAPVRAEAKETVEAHQKVYNLIMDEKGPYVKLKDLSHAIWEHERLEELEAQFSEIYDTRSAIEKEFTKNKEAYEHCRHQIEDLEDKLSDRSRLTFIRRPGGRPGSRKIDEMRDRLSRLRRQHEAAGEKAAYFGEKLRETEASTKHALMEMENQLRHMEFRRIAALSAEIQRYINYLQAHDRQNRAHKLSFFGKSDKHGLEGLEESLKTHWTDVLQNAELGGRPTFQKLFEATSAREMKNTASSPRSRPPSAVSGKRAAKSSSVTSSTSLSSSASGGSSVSSDLGESAVATVGQMQIRERASLTAPNKISSEESIETLDLPPETRCRASLNQLEPNKLFSSQYDRLPKKASVTEYSEVKRYKPENSDTDIRFRRFPVQSLCNVRVMAIEDSEAVPGSLILSFKKGQIIKQKNSINSQGLCYGWTRENRIGKKQYGFYNPKKVQVLREEDVQ